MTSLLRHWPFVSLLACAAMLGAAHAFETFGHLSPCALCLKAREVYWAALTVSVVGVALSFTSLHARQLICAILALTFFGGAALAVYHAGAEWKFWPGPASCSGGAGHVDAADLARLLHGATMRSPSCETPAWVFLGVSMAGWNGLVSLGLALGSAMAARRSSR